MVDWKAQWKQAKKDFKKEAGKKPAEKFLGVFRRGSGLTDAFGEMEKANDQLFDLREASPAEFKKGVAKFKLAMHKASKLAKKYEILLLKAADNDTKVARSMDILKDCIKECLEDAENMLTHRTANYVREDGDVLQTSQAPAAMADSIEVMETRIREAQAKRQAARQGKIKKEKVAGGSAKVATPRKTPVKTGRTRPSNSDLTKWMAVVKEANEAIQAQRDSVGAAIIDDLANLQPKLHAVSLAMQKASPQVDIADIKQTTNVFSNMKYSLASLSIEDIQDAVNDLGMHVRRAWQFKKSMEAGKVTTQRRGING